MNVFSGRTATTQSAPTSVTSAAPRHDLVAAGKSDPHIVALHADDLAGNEVVLADEPGDEGVLGCS